MAGRSEPAGEQGGRPFSARSVARSARLGRPCAHIEVEDLDPIPAAVKEQEEMAGQEVLREAFLNQAGEAVEALAQVRRPGAEEDPDGRGEQDHDVAS